jgi:hypothetical protein
MHARVEHLLSLRDGGPIDAEVRAHVHGCPQCTAALADVTALPARLRALRPVEPDSRGWEDVRARLARRRSADVVRVRMSRAAAVASLTVIVSAVAWRVAEMPNERSLRPVGALVAPPTAEEVLALDRVARLRQQSSALEAALATIGERPAVQRAGTALPIDALEAQVQWIDHRISASGDALEAEQLWRERVDAMNTLVRLRYVESQPLAM